MNAQPLRFYHRGAIVTLHTAPDRTLLDLLREDLHCTGTKEGCAEGDCGACTVVLGESRDGKLAYRAINSCIKLAPSIDGHALWTVEDLQGPDQRLHPAQAALLHSHGSQCGFCTPGFVMSLFAQYAQRNGAALSREQALGALSGNLCRCTGYRPILEAAQSMHQYPPVPVDEGAVLQGLATMASSPAQDPPPGQPATEPPAYLRPTTLPALLQLRATYPQAQLVAGCTDVGLWVTKGHRGFERVLDITRVEALRAIEHYPHHLAIGAAAALTDAFAALVAERPQLAEFAHRFAGLPVRNAGTLGGNVANGSPIGDSMPLLIALGANVLLMGVRGHRELRLEDLYTGYRQTAMAADEVVAWIKVPRPLPTEFLRVYKVSKRREDDISAVCLAICLQLESGRVVSASIGAGGVAATPVRARQTEAALRGQPWNLATVQAAAAVLRTEFAPISDMRASAHYRATVLGNLLQRFWRESQGEADCSLETLSLEGSA